MDKVAIPLTKVKEKFQVTIPTKVRKTLRLEVGDLLEATAKNNTIVLRPKAVIDRKSIDVAITRGLEDVKHGRVSPVFSSVKEFKAYLKKR